MAAVLPALLCAVTVGTAAVLLGAPLALAVRGTNQGFLATVFDAAVLGLSAGGLTLVLLGNVGPLVASGAGVLWIAVGVGLAARRGIPSAQWMRPRRLDGWTIALGLALFAGAAVRLRTTNVVAWIGDMGAYVNWANEFARTGELNARWPPLLPALMSAPAEVFGMRFTASVMPLFGMLMLAGLVRVTSLLGVPRPIQLGLVVVAAASPHLLWFSTFPASEMLQAVLLLGLVTLTAVGVPPGPAEGRAYRNVALGVAAATLTAAMTLNRGQAVGLVVPVLLVSAALLGAPRSAAPAALRWWTAGAVFGLGLGHIYGVTVIPRYWIRLQLETTLPPAAMDIIRSVGLLHGATATVIVFALTGSLVLILWFIDRVGTRRRASSPAAPGSTGTTRRVSVACVALAVAGTILIMRSGAGEVDAALGRIGWLLPVVALLGLVLPGARAKAGGAPVLLLGATTAVYLLLHVTRFDEETVHTIYLYWDRYLLSEYLPCVLCLGAVGIAAVVDAVAGRVVLRRAGLVLAGAAAVGLVISWIPRVQLQTERHAFAGMYEFVQGLAARTEPGAPVVWSADVAGDVPRVFPNSIWAFGSPLWRGYGREILGLPPESSNFTPDPVVSRHFVLEAAACSPTKSTSVVEWRRTPDSAGIATRLADEELTWHERGRVEVMTWVLGQSDVETFQPVVLIADVYEVTVPADTACTSSR